MLWCARLFGAGKSTCPMPTHFLTPPYFIAQRVAKKSKPNQHVAFDSEIVGAFFWRLDFLFSLSWEKALKRQRGGHPECLASHSSLALIAWLYIPFASQCPGWGVELGHSEEPTKWKKNDEKLSKPFQTPLTASLPLTPSTKWLYSKMHAVQSAMKLNKRLFARIFFIF